MIEFSLAIAAAERDQDRAEVANLKQLTVLALADGAGGLSGGKKAAETSIQFLTSSIELEKANDCQYWTEKLRVLDKNLHYDRDCGETTVVVIAISNDAMLCGASVGDSGAWLFNKDETIDLTAGQRRRPLLGSGAATISPVEAEPLKGRLLMASDGLLKYSPWTRIQELVTRESMTGLSASLIDSARMKSGTLHDDIAVIVCQPLKDR
jgi:serine/threonine protein phosphatase PrpC